MTDDEPVRVGYAPERATHIFNAYRGTLMVYETWIQGHVSWVAPEVRMLFKLGGVSKVTAYDTATCLMTTYLEPPE